jgi:hypothetical protein
MRTINCIEGKIYVQSRGPISVEWTISVYDKQNTFISYFLFRVFVRAEMYVAWFDRNQPGIRTILKL